MYILLTTDQSNLVRGLTVTGHALAPKPIKVAASAQIAGKFVLPDSVLTDPYHVSLRPILSSFPTIAENLVLLSDWDTDPTVVANNTYSPITWTIGKLISVPASTV